MQVKRFEARTMKEALEMVKRELGPDAIILSAKDIGSRYGLVGNGSVEITAAVSEGTLEKRRFAESRMRPDTKEKFQSSSARMQRRVVDKFVEKYQSDSTPKEKTRIPASQRYIDIRDDNEMPIVTLAETRIKSAAQRAWDALRYQADESEAAALANKAKNTSAKLVPVVVPEPTHSNVESNSEMKAIKEELAQLKVIFGEIGKVPQNFANQHPGSSYGLSYDFSPSFEKLTRAGISEKIAGEILADAQEKLPRIKHKSRGLIDGWVAKHILDTTEVSSTTNLNGLHCFVGPRGSGKTSTLVKFAGQALVEGRKTVAIVTADTVKVGAIDQMKIYSQILNAPLAVVKRSQDWSALATSLKEYDLVLCDFPGLSLKTAEELDLLKSLLPRYANCQVHLNLASTARDLDIEETARRYESIGYTDLIFNYLDEAHLHGGIYNLMLNTGKPLLAFGTGPRVPDDLEGATKERMLDLIFKLTKLKKMQEL